MPIKDITKVKKHLFLCNGDSCIRNGAKESTMAIRECIKKLELQKEVHTTRTLCNGRCDDGPIVIIQPDGVWYKQITCDKAEELVTEQIVYGRVLKDNLLYKNGEGHINSDSIATV